MLCLWFSEALKLHSLLPNCWLVFVCCPKMNTQRYWPTVSWCESHDVSSLSERLHCPVVAAVFDSFFCWMLCPHVWWVFVSMFNLLPVTFRSLIRWSHHMLWAVSEEWCMSVTWKPCAPRMPLSIHSACSSSLHELFQRVKWRLAFLNTQKCNYRMSFPFRLTQTWDEGYFLIKRQRRSTQIILLSETRGRE